MRCFGNQSLSRASLVLFLVGDVSARRQTRPDHALQTEEEAICRIAYCESDLVLWHLPEGTYRLH